MKIIVAYSGGKDSQASLIWAVKEFGAKNIEAIFCDTGWENPITYKHIKDTTNDLCVKLVTVKSKKYKGMVDLAKKRKRFPSTMARFCTEELKSMPLIDYVLDQKDDILMIQGIRGDESISRSKMEKQCRQFKYYTEPYKIDKKGKPKLFYYRKKDVLEFISKYSDDILRPVFEWTGQQVVDYIIKNKQKPNPLYYQGFKRVGCFPCIMSSQAELFQILKRYPNRFDEIIEHEVNLKSSFFKPDYIPEKYRTGFCPKSGKTFSKAIDIRKYINGKNMTIDMFEEETISCSSFYHLCE